MAEGIQIKNLPSTTAVKQGDTMTIVQDKQNKQLALDVFANESDLAALSPLENRCDEVKAKIEVDEYSAEITTSQSMSEIGSDDNGANLHENVLDGAYEACVLKGKTKYKRTLNKFVKITTSIVQHTKYRAPHREPLHVGVDGGRSRIIHGDKSTTTVGVDGGRSLTTLIYPVHHP